MGDSGGCCPHPKVDLRGNSLLETDRDEFQRGDILAELAQGYAAARTGEAPNTRSARVADNRAADGAPASCGRRARTSTFSLAVAAATRSAADGGSLGRIGRRLKFEIPRLSSMDSSSSLLKNPFVPGTSSNLSVNKGESKHEP